MNDSKYMNLRKASFNILLQADYVSIINYRNRCRAFFQVYRMPHFWEQKTLLDFKISRRGFKDIQQRDNKARYEYLMTIDPDNGLRDSCKSGSIELAKYFVLVGANNYDDATFIAAKHGNIEIAKLMISLGVNDYIRISRIAASHGHIDIVKYMISLGADNYDDVIRIAAKYGRIEIVKYMISFVTDYVMPIKFAKRHGHKDVVTFLSSL